MGLRFEDNSPRTPRCTYGKPADEKNTEHPLKEDIRCTADYFGRENAAVIWAFVTAFLTGVLASLGVGGGMLLIIYLTVFGGFDQLSAQGINLIYFLPIALLSVIIHSRSGLVEWKRIVPSLIAGVISAPLGAWLAQSIGSPVLKKIFAVFILIIGIRELLCSSDKPCKSQE